MFPRIQKIREEILREKYSICLELALNQGRRIMAGDQEGRIGGLPGRRRNYIAGVYTMTCQVGFGLATGALRLSSRRMAVQRYCAHRLRTINPSIIILSN